LWGPSGAEQLQQVGRQAYQFPLAANIVQAAQAEAPEASPLLVICPKTGSTIALRIL
jgi:hypothetical protein